MRKLTTILRTPEHITGRTALPGSFALVDFALWCVLCAPTSHILMTFWQLGAVLCRMVPLTPTEREMRRRLGEMRVLEQEPTA